MAGAARTARRVSISGVWGRSGAGGAPAIDHMSRNAGAIANWESAAKRGRWARDGRHLAGERLRQALSNCDHGPHGLHGRVVMIEALPAARAVRVVRVVRGQTL